MKNLLKNANKKIIAVLLVIMLLLSTVAIYQITAATAEEESRGNGSGDGGYITLDDLVNQYDILCCQHGTHLGNGVPLSFASVTDSGKEIIKLKPSDVGEKVGVTKSSSRTSPYTEKSYKAESLAYYEIISSEIATPKEAYILAEMTEENGGAIFYDEYSEIQYAWWTTAAGGKGKSVMDTPLAAEAEAFEEYIGLIGSTDPSTFVEQHYSYEIDGVLHEGTVPAPVLNYSASYDKDINRDGVVDEKDEVTTTWDNDKQTWTVGPFIVDYVEADYSSGVRPDVTFAGITGAELYTNLGVVDKSHWRFNFVEGERDTADRFEYPHADELFYVEIDFMEGATEVTNLHFDFKYMNAGGRFDTLSGVYYTETWSPKTKAVEWCQGPKNNETYCSHGYKKKHATKWEHWLQLTGMDEGDAQALAYGIIGARWYEYVSIDLEDKIVTDHTGSFRIIKRIVDKDGNELPNTDRNKQFKFEIFKDGDLYNTVYVSVNNPYNSPVYSWKDGETAPVFTVREVLEDGSGYKQYGEIKITGSLEDRTLIFEADNYQEEKESYVTIDKWQLGKGLEGQDFYFKLYINNKLYVQTEAQWPGMGVVDTTDENGIITLKVGQQFWSGIQTWTGDKAPTYKVVEVNIPEGSRLITIINQKGVLTHQKAAHAIAINQKEGPEYESATIVLKKEAEGNYSTDETFSFDIRVGENTYTKQLKIGETWSETFKWEKGTPAPDYEIKEVNMPTGWELKGYTVTDSNNPEDVKSLGKDEYPSGTLVANQTIDVVAKNGPTDQSAQIILRKITDKPTEEWFTIVTEIKGTFKYGEEEYGPTSENGDTKTVSTTLQVNQEVPLEKVTWQGSEAPSYKVTEVKIPKGWTLKSISNNEGKLENGKIVTVECFNSDDHIDHDGYFKIIKKIVDDEGNEIPEEELTDEQKNKEFMFEITKDGEFFAKVAVSYNKPYTSQLFVWKDGETAPSFSVKEILDEDETEYAQFGDVSVEGDLEERTLVFTGKNYEVEHKGKVSITKKQLGKGLEGFEFSFKLFIDGEVYAKDGKTAEDGTITLKVGETWTSDEITWKGKVGPTYRVDEIKLPKKAKLVGYENRTGNLIDNKTAKVVVINEEEGPEYDHATITVTKKAAGNVSSDESFSFKIRVGEQTFEKELKIGQTWSETFVWEKGTPAPDYEIEEVNIPDDWELVEITNKSGTLSNDAKIDVVATNDTTEKSGQLKITKITESEDKEGVDPNKDIFTMVTKISGTFEMDGESIVNGTKTITSTLKSGDTETLGLVKWKGKAPTYEVVETDLPDGWKLKEITNSKGSLVEDKVIEVVCTNEYKIREEYELTMEMAGRVWEDVALKPEDKNTPDSKPNGKYDVVESGVEKVEVDIWKKCYDENDNEIVSLRKLATGYEEGTDYPIDFPLYTTSDGVWEAPKMAVPGLLDSEKEAGAVRADYDVEFTYDGQTYKPTDFLVSGNVDHFRNASNKDRAQYLNDSMAYEVESERQAFDNKFETITGDTCIDDNGITDGYAVDAQGNKTDLLYYATDSMPTVEGNTRKISELQTLEDGYIRDQYKMKSRTSTGGLTYPFDDQCHLESVKKEIDKIEGGLVIRYKYSATYPYLLNVNLGLVRRDEAELALTKDVYAATVAVNQKLLNYKFNEYVDFESDEYKDYLNLQLKVADANIAYKLDLYESDYYYRAQVYDGNTELKGALEEFYKTLGKTNLSEELDLDVFLTYKISVYNQSDSYLAKVKSVVDYFDEDLELVDSNVTKYVQEADGKIVDKETVVATPAYVIKKGPTADSQWADQLNESIQGKIAVDYSQKYSSRQDVNSELSANQDMATSKNVRTEDTKSYYKAIIDLDNDSYKLAVGEKLDIYLTFKVRTDEAPAIFDGDAVTDAVNSYTRLGTKANIAEIASYTTYYHDKGTVAGKVDKDSAPNNIDIENKNDKSWYEDDSDSAPIITLDLYSETRDVDGFVWEDQPTEKIDYNQIIGNGMFDEGERLIGNLTTEMVEKVTVKQADGKYKEYDFVWPTHKQFDFLNNKTLEEITGFDSITLTSNSPENTGAYKFTNIPAGNYVVRVEYGNFPADYLDENGNTVKLEGVSEPKTSDDNRRQPAVYNGQDFKTTVYQADVINENGKSDYATNEQGYIDNNEWYDFTTAKYDEDGNIISHNSDVIDNEARRLEVIAYSRVLDNTVATVLATANDYSADHTELYKNTSMFADTAKINLNIENMNSLKGQKVVITDEKTGETVEVVAGDVENRNDLLTNTVIGKSDVNGEKGTVSVINYSYKIEAVDAGLEERSQTEYVLDKEIESITLTPNTGGEPILKAVYDIDYTFDLDEKTGKSKYKANVKLNEEKSVGTSNLMAQNKDEEAGLQNFRYVYYDDTISQSLNLEVVYKFAVLNLGEVDRAGKVSTLATAEEILAKAQELKDNTFKKEGNKLVSVAHPLVGEYVGSIYYLGRRGSYSQPDSIVTIKTRQLIDYVDNDAVFKATETLVNNNSWNFTPSSETPGEEIPNVEIPVEPTTGSGWGATTSTTSTTPIPSAEALTTEDVTAGILENVTANKGINNNDIDSSWKSVTADELLADKVIDSSIIQEVDGVNTILDDKGVAYTTTQRNNIVLSVDETKGDKLANPGFIIELVPFAASKENKDTTETTCQTAMKMVMTRSIDSEIDEEDLSYDNIAEIVKLENTVGKRDLMNIPGNVNPKGGYLGYGEFAASLDERDASATELITFTPPTGLGVQRSLTIEVMIVGLAALTILGTGIVLIKKYVIK